MVAVHVTLGTPWLERGRARAARGFTITELLIVVTVFAVLVGAALPSYNQFVKNQRVKSASFDLFSSLVLARSEAITRNASVTVTPAVSGTTAWAGGWTVASGGTTLRTQQAIPNITITGPSSVTYSASGRLAAAASPFALTASGGTITSRCITIDLSGRPVTKDTAC